MKIVATTGLVGLSALEWTCQSFCLGQSIGIDETNTFELITFLAWKLWVPQAWAACGR